MEEQEEEERRMIPSKGYERMRVKDKEFAPDSESEGIVIQSKLQTCLERIKVVPPPELIGQEYFIHGKVSVTDDLEKEPIILFDRPTPNYGEYIKFGDPLFGFLCISESKDPESPCPRPLDDPRSVLYLTFQLSMVKCYLDDDEEDEDVAIANFENYRYCPEEECGSTLYRLREGSREFEIKGEHGFSFTVKYGLLAGTHVRVQLAINKNLNPNPQEQEQGEGEVSASGICSPVYGRVEACHKFICTDAGRICLLLKSRDEPPACAPIGEPIPLDRTIVLAPAAFPSYLYLKLQLYNSHDRSLVAQEVVPFPVKTIPDTDYPPKFIIRKQRTFAKHILDGLITLSITFLDPELPT